LCIAPPYRLAILFLEVKHVVQPIITFLAIYSVLQGLVALNLEPSGTIVHNSRIAAMNRMICSKKLSKLAWYQ